MPNDTHDPIDFSALDPLRDREAFDARVALVARDAMDARTRRDQASAESSSIVSALVSWARPTVLAAGIVLAIALSAVASGTAAPPASTPTVSAAEAMGLPRRLTEILHSTAQPSLTALDVALAASASP